MEEDIYWWRAEDSDEQWIEEQVRRYEQEQWEAEQDARKWAAVPEERDLGEDLRNNRINLTNR